MPFLSELDGLGTVYRMENSYKDSKGNNRIGVTYIVPYTSKIAGQTIPGNASVQAGTFDSLKLAWAEMKKDHFPDMVETQAFPSLHAKKIIVEGMAKNGVLYEEMGDFEQAGLIPPESERKRTPVAMPSDLDLFIERIKAMFGVR